MTLLIQLPYTISPNTCKLGMKRCGAGLFQKWTPEQILALRYNVSGDLKAFEPTSTHGYPLLAYKAAYDAVNYKYAVKPEFATFKHEKETGAPTPDDQGVDDEDPAGLTPSQNLRTATPYITSRSICWNALRSF